MTSGDFIRGVHRPKCLSSGICVNDIKGVFGMMIGRTPREFEVDPRAARHAMWTNTAERHPPRRARGIPPSGARPRSLKREQVGQH